MSGTALSCVRPASRRRSPPRRCRRSRPRPCCRRRSPAPRAAASPARPQTVHVLLADLVDAAPDADEGVALDLLADRRRLAVAGVDAGLRRQLDQPHHRGPEVVEAARAGRHRPADRALEEDVGGEDVAAVDRGRRGGRRRGPGVEIASISRPPVESLPPSSISSATSSSISAAASGWATSGDSAEPLLRRREPGDVVGMGVGDEDVGDLDPVALGPLEQRVEQRRCRRSGRPCRDSSSATR